jgi:hypothetical protein
MSALPPKTDIGTQSRDVRFVPKAGIPRRSKEVYSITSSAMATLDFAGASSTWRAGQHNRSLDLSIWHVPVGLEQRSLARGRDQLEAVAPVEADGPMRGFPGTNQDLPCAELPQMLQQSAANAAPLAAGQDISVTNEIDIVYRLETHHACQPAVLLIAPEHYAGGDLAVEFVPRHVGLMPPIGRDHATISLGGSVDDCQDRLPTVVTAAVDFGHEPIVDYEVVARDNGSERPLPS